LLFAFAGIVLAGEGINDSKATEYLKLTHATTPQRVAVATER
jgi:hypothetical protein